MENTDYRKQFAENLSNLMKLFKMSNRELAQELKLSDITVSQYTRGIRFPDIDILCRLTYIFNVTLDQLVGREKQTSVGTWFTAEQYNSVMQAQKSICEERLKIEGLLEEFRTLDEKISRMEKEIARQAGTKKSPSDIARGSEA